MSGISIKKSHSLGAEGARQRMEAMESKLQEKYGVKLSWSGHRAEIKGTGVKGTVQVGEMDVSIDLSLGLMLKPMTGKIRELMEQQVERALS